MLLKKRFHGQLLGTGDLKILARGFWRTLSPPYTFLFGPLGLANVGIDLAPRGAGLTSHVGSLANSLPIEKL